MPASIKGPLLALLLATLTPSVLLAQAPNRNPAPPPTAPAPATAPTPAPAADPGESPDRTMAVFGDWIMRCAVRAAPATGRNCEMAQTTADQRQQPVAVLAIGRKAHGEPLRLVAQVPVNVQPAQAARLALDGPGRTEAPLLLPFRHCILSGCFAEVELREDSLRRLRGRAADAAGRLEWRNAAGQDTAIAVSFRGFNAAYEALSKEPE